MHSTTHKKNAQTGAASFAILNAIATLPLPTGPKYLLTRICIRQGHHTNCWPSQARLAVECTVDDRTVRRWLTMLTDGRYITVTGKTRGTRYSVNVDEILSAAPDTSVRNDADPLRTPVSEITSDSGHQCPPLRTPTSYRKDTKEQKTKTTRVEIPEKLQTDAFTAAWSDWQQHRREQRKPLTPTTATAQLTMLAGHDADTATRMLRQAIERGWMGLFPPKEPETPHHATATAPDIAELMRAAGAE